MAACGGEPRSHGYEPQRTDSAGVEIVINGAESRFFELEETLRIGVVTGEEQYQFHRIRGIDVAPDGRILVANGGTSSLRMYSPDGRFLREMGGPGDGPGEFRFMFGGELVGDSVIVLGSGSRTPRITLFHQSGEPGRTVSLGVRASSGFGMVFTDSAWYAWLRELPSSPVPDGELADAHWTVHRVDPSTGELERELHRLPGGRVVGAGREFGFPPIFDPSPEAMPYRGRGAIIPAGDSYELRILDDDGTLVRMIRRVHEPVEITDDDRERYRREIRAYHSAEGRSEEGIEAALSRIPQSHVIPPFIRVMTTDDGGLWVRRQDYGDDPLDRALGPMAGEEPSTDPVLWDGFAADGRYLGSVWIPFNFRPRLWRDDWVVGVYEDELDVQFVVRYDLMAPGD